MRLRKFTAVSLAAAMTAAAITGCGNREQEREPDVKAEGRTVSAESFSDVLKKSSEISNYDYEADVTFSIKSDDLFTYYADEEMAQILDAFGIASDKIDLTFTIEGSVKGTDAQSMTLGFEIGNLSGDLTEIIYVDDTLYVNVSKTVDFIKQAADKIGLGDMVSTYMTLLPEGDYIAVSKDMLTQIGEAVLESTQHIEGDFNALKPDTEALEKAIYYLMDEVEKAAKNAENVYSSQKGYSVNINNANMFSFIAASIGVLAEDKDEIIKNVQIIADDANIKTSIEDAFNSMQISTEEEREKFLEDFKTAKEEMPEFDITVSGDYSGQEGSAVGSFDCSMKVKDEEADMTMSVSAKITENSSVKINAPESVMSQEDIESILSLIGIDSPEDITDMFGGMDYGYDFDDDSNGSFDDIAA